MGWGGLGIKILNLSLPCPGVRGQNIAPSLPHHPCGAGRVKVERGKIVIPSANSSRIFIKYILLFFIAMYCSLSKIIKVENT